MIRRARALSPLLASVLAVAGCRTGGAESSSGASTGTQSGGGQSAGMQSGGTQSGGRSGSPSAGAARALPSHALVDHLEWRWIAEGGPGACALATDAEAVYRADESDGTIVRHPLSGGAVTVIAARQGEPVGLAVDERHAFWVASATERLRRAPKLGGAFGGLATDTSGPAQIALDDTHAFVSRSRREKREDEAVLVRMSKDGSDPAVLLRREPSWRSLGIALDADHVYLGLIVTPEKEYEDKGTLLRIAKTGGEAETLASDLGRLRSFVLDGDFLYFTALTSQKEGELARMPKSGGARQTLYKAAARAAPVALALDATHVFFTDETGGVWRVPREGGDAHKLADLPGGGDTATELAATEPALWACGGRGLFELSWSPFQGAPDLFPTEGSAAEAIVMDRGGHVIGADFAGRAHVYDPATGRILQDLGQAPGHDHRVHALGLGAGGQTLIIADQEGEIESWDLASGTRKWTTPSHARTTPEVPAFAISPDGTLLLHQIPRQPARLVSAETGRDLRGFPDRSESVGAIAISPDNRFWLTAERPVRSHKHPKEPGGKLLRMWDLTNGKALGTFDAEPEWVNAVAITADGKRAVTAGDAGILRVWDIASRAAVITFPAVKGPLVDVALSRSGERALTTSPEEGTCLWDLVAKKRLACSPARSRASALFYGPGRVAFDSSETEAWWSTSHGLARWKLPE